VTKLFLSSITLLICLSACQQDTQNAQNDSSETEISEEPPPEANRLSEDQQIYYETQGDEIVTRSAQALGQKLMEALSDGGVSNALAFCNENALTITDSLSENMGVAITRTSLNYRNIANQPHQLEEEMLTKFSTQHKAGKSIKPITAVTPDGEVLYASPILVNMLCLKCHGNVGTDIKEENYQLVKNLYPYDKAIDYKAGDFRGMWVVRFR